MKKNRLLGLFALAILTVSPMYGKLTREQSTTITQIANRVASLRSDVVKATPATAAQVLDKINQAVTSMNRVIDTKLKGVAPSTLANVRQNIQQGLLPSIAQLNKKIQQAQADEAASRLRAAAARMPAPPPVPSAPPVVPPPVPSAPPVVPPPVPPPPVPSAPPEPSAPPVIDVRGYRADMPEELPSVAPIPNFNANISYAEALEQFKKAGRLPLEDALNVVAYNLIKADGNVSDETALKTLYKEIILPFMLENWENEYPRGRETFLARSLDTLARPLKWVISDPIRWIMGDMPIPTKGEFTPAGLQAFQDWVTHLKRSIKNRHAVENLLKGAIAGTKEGVSRFRAFKKGAIPVTEQNARILLAAHILNVANELFPRPEKSGGGTGRNVPQQADTSSQQPAPAGAADSSGFGEAAPDDPFSG